MQESHEVESTAPPAVPAGLPASTGLARGNALRHGLTATTLIEQLVGAMHTRGR